MPSGSTQLSQQAQQALTAEGGYLQAVSATLSDPTSANAAQLQPLATSTSTAMVPLASVAPGAQTSLSGTDGLNGWAAARVAAAARAQAAATRREPGAGRGRREQHEHQHPEHDSPASSGRERNRLWRRPARRTEHDVRVRAERATGVVRRARAVNTLQVYSPVTGLTYTMNCAPAAAASRAAAGTTHRSRGR